MTSSSAGSPIDIAEDAAPHKHGIGVLEVLKEQKPVALPLARMDITAKVGGCFADVQITQVFRNDHSDPLEAVYTFPMPGAAAVSSFEMQAGGRTIFGVVAEREEARRRYDEALEQGRTAGLLEQERDDVFTLQVGNIPPNEDVTITLRYSEPLTLFESGSTELRLPLVLGLRYVPGKALDRMPTGDGIEPDTDIVPDASRISPPRLVPGFDPQTDLRIQVELLGDTAVADLTCSQHAVRLQTAPGATTITLARERELLNRDFVLRWRAAGESVTSTLLYHRTPDGALFGALSMVTPAGDAAVSLPRDVVFLLDKSGSMMGPKIASATRACAKLIATLGPSDRFALLSFSDQWAWLHGTSVHDRFIHADQAGIARGQQLLRSVEAEGGTELDAALGGALAAINHVDRAGRTPVVVLITDGEVMDEKRILSRVQKTRGNARIFTVGIDTAVNSALLSRLAAIGRGTSAFVEPDAALDSALEAIGREIGTPLVTDLRIVGDGLIDLAPETVPDLFPGRVATIFFRSSAIGAVTLLGRYANGSPFSSAVQARTVDLPAIVHLWARGRVRDLEDRFRVRGDDHEAVRQEIISVSLAHTVLTRFTAFIAIDDRAAVEDPRQRRKIVQPVHVPDQWPIPIPPPPMSRMPGLAAPDASPMSAMADMDVTPRASRTLSMPTGSPVRRARHELEEAVANFRRLLEKFAKSAETALLEQFLQRIERLIEILDRQDAQGSKTGLVHALEDLRVAVRELLDRRARFEAAARRSLQQLTPHEDSWWKRFWEKTV